MIALYVDDLLITGSSIEAVLLLKSKLADCFKMRGCGELMYVQDLKILGTAKPLHWNLVKQIIQKWYCNILELPI